MSSYFKFHTASGHILSKMTVIEDALLSDYAAEGYSFIPTELPFGNHYIVEGEPHPRVRVAFGGRRNAGNDEIVTISGLPSDAWVIVGEGDPVRAVNGIVQVSQIDDGEVLVQLVGKYTGGLMFVSWSDLGALKTRSKRRVDNMAETARTRVVTPGSGQAMTYLRKADAARMFLANEPLSDAQAQRLSDEAARMDTTIEEAAQALVALADQWEAIDATIDNLRLTTKADIDAATTGLEIEAIIAGLSWPV
jgi:hypothetical protein